MLTKNTTILEQNNKQKLQILKCCILEINTLNLIELILNPVLMYSNVFSYYYYLLNQILENKSYTIH